MHDQKPLRTHPSRDWVFALRPGVTVGWSTLVRMGAHDRDAELFVYAEPDPLRRDRTRTASWRRSEESRDGSRIPVWERVA